LDKNTGEVIDFKCRPTLKGLLGQLDKLGKYFPRRTLRLGYEASYIGYTLQRDLAAKGTHCDIVAPKSIPNPGCGAGTRPGRDALAPESITAVNAAAQAHTSLIAP
jgi:hypothetical protein